MLKFSYLFGNNVRSKTEKLRVRFSAESILFIFLKFATFSFTLLIEFFLLIFSNYEILLTIVVFISIFIIRIVIVLSFHTKFRRDDRTLSQISIPIFYLLSFIFNPFSCFT